MTIKFYIMGNISLSHKVIVFEAGSAVEPSSGEIELYADNGNWHIETNSSECEQHISVSPTSGTSDATINVTCDGTPKDPGFWSLKFFLDNVFKASLEIYSYEQSSLPDPVVPNEDTAADPICQTSFTTPIVFTIQDGITFVENMPSCCPNCGATRESMKLKLEELVESKIWDEEEQDYYIEIELDGIMQKVYLTLATQSNIAKLLHDTQLAIIRNIG